MAGAKNVRHHVVIGSGVAGRLLSLCSAEEQDGKEKEQKGSHGEAPHARDFGGFPSRQ